MLLNACPFSEGTVIGCECCLDAGRPAGVPDDCLIGDGERGESCDFDGGAKKGPLGRPAGVVEGTGEVGCKRLPAFPVE